MGTTPHEVTWSPLAASLVRNPIRTLFERCQRDKEIIALVGGKPTASLFPVREMTLSLAAGGALAAPLDEACMNYGPHQAGGTAALREWGAARVKRECAPPFDDWSTITTGGSTDGIFKAVLALTSEGEAILAAEHTYTGLLASARALRRVLAGVPADAGGMDPSHIPRVCAALRRRGVRPAMLYVIPTGQNPTGITMSRARRRAVYEAARAEGLLVLEDAAYDGLQLGAVGDGGRPEKMPGAGAAPPSLLALDVDRRVVRLETGAKLFAPGFRVGWLTASSALVAKMWELSEITTWSQSGVAQAALGAVLGAWGEEGYDAHVRALQAEYTRRRDLFGGALDATPGLRARLEWATPTDGMFFWLKLRPRPDGRAVDAGALLEKLLDAKVAILPGGGFRAVDHGAGGASNGFRVSFAQLDDAAVARAACARLAAVLDDDAALDAAADADEDAAAREAAAAPPVVISKQTVGLVAACVVASAVCVARARRS